MGKAKLKQSAVDAWMMSEVPIGSGQWYIRGDEYVWEYGSVTRPTGVSGGGEYIPISRSGTSGDLDSREMTDFFQSTFADIRSTIDSIVDPWSDVPPASGLDGALEVAREIANGLKSEGSLEEGVILPANGVLAGALKRIDSYAGFMAGEDDSCLQRIVSESHVWCTQ